MSLGCLFASCQCLHNLPMSHGGSQGSNAPWLPHKRSADLDLQCKTGAPAAASKQLPLRFPRRRGECHPTLSKAVKAKQAPLLLPAPGGGCCAPLRPRGALREPKRRLLPVLRLRLRDQQQQQQQRWPDHPSLPRGQLHSERCTELPGGHVPRRCRCAAGHGNRGRVRPGAVGQHGSGVHGTAGGW